MPRNAPGTRARRHAPGPPAPRGCGGTRASLGGRWRGAFAGRFMWKPRARAVWRATSPKRPPLGRVGRGPGWSPVPWGGGLRRIGVRPDRGLRGSARSAERPERKRRAGGSGPGATAAGGRAGAFGLSRGPAPVGRGCGGTRPSLGGRRRGAWGERFMVKPRTRGVWGGASPERPPGGRVGRGPGWSPGQETLS